MAGFTTGLALLGLGLIGGAAARNALSGDGGSGSDRRRANPNATVLAPGSGPLSGPGTDNRQRTPNATETGRKAVPRPGTNPGAPTPPGATIPAGVDAASYAALAAARMRKRGRGDKRGISLTGDVVPASLNPRSLLGS